jgi:hypothetical protein
VDKRALKILFDLYWSGAGWHPDVGRRSHIHLKLSPEDFAYGKRAGVLFDPIRISHDAVLRRARAARDAVKVRTVADGFIASLSSRRLEWRSALGSYAVLRHLDEHPAPPPGQLCPVCGMYDEYAEPEDLNVLNFERFKWGGVRHDQTTFAAFDLEQFSQAGRAEPTPEDVGILKRLVEAIGSAPPTTTATELQKALAPVLRSNKAEREVLIGILGLCGVLNTGVHEGFFSRFIRFDERELPPQRFADMHYPACWWRGRDGLCDDVLRFYFGHVLDMGGGTRRTRRST